MSSIIFDVDGTLIDNNEAHVEAWRRAFATFSVRLDRGRIRAEIGKGGDLLVPAILGEQRDGEIGDAVREAHDAAYLDLCRVTRFALTAGAMELLAELRRRRARTAAATSSKPRELEAALTSSGLDLRAWVDVVVTSEKVDASKPAPSLFAAAATRLRVAPRQCVVVGDTRYDGEAASVAGMAFVGLTCGGIPAADLVSAGARGVFADPRELLDNLDDVLATSGPPPLSAPGP